MFFIFDERQERKPPEKKRIKKFWTITFYFKKISLSINEFILESEI